MRCGIPLAASVLAPIALACASSVEVSFDEREDFTRFRTWNWLPQQERVIEASDGDRQHLGRVLARQVEAVLRERGFERVRGDADLRVGVRLRVRRGVRTVYRTGAVQYLSSFHASPSYEIQTVEREEQPYEEGHLELVVAGGEEPRVIWRAELEQRVRGEIRAHLASFVERALEAFPPPPSAPGQGVPAVPAPPRPAPSTLVGGEPDGAAGAEDGAHPG